MKSVSAQLLFRTLHLLILLVLIVPLVLLNASTAYAHGTVDQSFLISGSWSQICSGDSGWNGQTFIPTKNTIIGFDIYFDGSSGASGLGTVFSITEYPNVGNILATAPASTVADGQAHFELTSALKVNPFQKYAIMLTGGSNTCFRSEGGPAATYSGGSAVRWTGSEDSTFDLAFQTYYPPDTNPPSTQGIKFFSPQDGFSGNELVGLTGGTVTAQPLSGEGIAIDSGSGISSLTVNGIPATFVGDNWTVNNVPLNEGANPITIVVKDAWLNTTTLNGEIGYSADYDNDGIYNNVDGVCPPNPITPTMDFPSNQYCDVLLGGSSNGTIAAKSAGVAVTITNASPEPEGVNVEVTGPAGGTLETFFQGKSSLITLEPGSYVLTDPDKTIKVQVISGHAEISYEFEGEQHVILIEDSSSAQFVEKEDGTATVSTLSGNVTVNGNTLTVGATFNIGGTPPSDTTDPSVNLVAPASNAVYLLNQVVNADYSCSDAGSGILSCVGPVVSGNAIDTSTVGKKSFAVTATDNAGNTSIVTHNYTVLYEWSGFLQPINSDNSSIFKLGSTVPVKFQLINSSAAISTALAKLYVAKIDNGIEGSVVEAVSNASADSGNTFRYESLTSQYIFNLGTRGLTTGTYKLRVYVGGDNNTGSLQGEVEISLK
jgi:hypothetical protein